MKKIHIKRILSLIICAGMLIQAFGSFSVFAADGIYSINYNDRSDESKGRYNLGTSHDDPMDEYTIGEPLENFPEPPSRIVNERFDGWYANGIKLEEGMPITEDMCMMPGLLFIEAVWLKDCGDITDFEISTKDNGDNVLNQSMTLYDEDGNQVDFTPERTEYSAVIDADVYSANMKFNVFEPAAEYQITYNGEEIASTSVYNQSLCNDNGINKNVDSSISVASEDFAVGTKTNNQIVITVTAPDGKTKKVYTINLSKTNERIALNYGNTVYGLIMRNFLIAGDDKESAKKEFDENSTYIGRRYSSKAWGEGVEIPDGNDPQEGEYINYDKDETAMVVYTGHKFKDTGFTVYGTDGEPVALSSSATVKRTVYYDKITSPDFDSWSSAVPATDTAILTGAEGEDVISVLEDNFARPGIGKIIYEYTDENGHEVVAKRNLVIIPKDGDLNMDGYTNALDVSVYSRTNLPDESTLSGRIYKYRCLDINMDEKVDDADMVILKDSRQLMNTSGYATYRDESVYDDLNLSPYTPSAAADPNKAQMYMDYLGKNSDAIINDASALPASPQESEELEIGDIFWIGYRVSKANTVFSGGIRSLTISLDYDTRYVEPVSLLTAEESTSLETESEKWKKTIEKYNKLTVSDKTVWGSDYEFTGMTEPAATYLEDNSTAASSLETGRATVKRMIIDIASDGTNSRAITDSGDYYLIRIPIKVIKMPIPHRYVISATLGADYFNISTGTSGENAKLWDNSDSVKATANMKDYVDYRGDYVPTIVDNSDTIELPDAVYGEPYLYKNEEYFDKNIIEDASALPPGLTHIRSMSQISGKPTWTGTYVFYINEQKFSITVNKAEMEVIAADKTKTYGDTNPSLDFTYNTADLKNDDTLESAGFTSGLTAPSISCAADTRAEYGSQTPIILSGGEAENYQFKYTNGTLTVDKQKEIVINSVDSIPACTSQEASQETFPYNKAASARFSAKGFGADGILDGDDVEITYDVIYKNNKPGENITVGLDNFAMNEDYAQSKNYTISKVNVSESNKGKVSGRMIERIWVREDPKRIYTYGETLDLSGGNICIRYDDGQEESGIHFNNAASYGITVSYENASDHAAPSHGEQVSIGFHNGRKIMLTAETINGTGTAVMNNPIVVNPKPLNVYADNKSKTYGDANPELTYHFNESDLVNGDTMQTLTNFSEPQVSCAATTSTPAGTSTITVSGGGADNYEFVYNRGTLTINQRVINVSAITGPIPPLTAKIFYQDLTAASYDVTGGMALLDQFEAENIVNNDDIRINFTAVYYSNKEAENVEVGIKDVTVDAIYGAGRNYTVGTYPEKAQGGVIFSSEVEAFELVTPPKLRYTYGEGLDLYGISVHVSLDNGDERDVRYSDLEHLGLKIVYKGTNTEPQQGEKLTVEEYNGKELSIIADDENIYHLPPVDVGRIVMVKKAMHVMANDVETVYGNNPVLSLTYDEEDFAYDETALDASFLQGLTAPSLSCTANSTSSVGEYPVTAKGGEAANYEFVYVPGVCTIVPRTIDVTAITGGIPPLTAKQIFEESGNIHYVAGEVISDSNNVEISNLVNGDVVKLSYNAVYESVTPVEQCSVGIDSLELVSGYGRNQNYVLGQKVAYSDGGQVLDREILSVEITQQPKLSYIYGQNLDLSGGRVKITYDSGLIEDNIAFDDLGDNRIALTYTGTSDTASSGDALNVPYHNGKTITLTPKTIYENVSVQTDTIEVEKKLLTYGSCIVNPIVYDGSKTVTTGTIVLEGSERGETPSATGVFTFDNYLAGTSKTVNITNIKLDAQSDLNYRLTSDSVRASGTIEKAEITPEISVADISISADDNSVKIAAPPLTDKQLAGGAEYEFSIDGGQTWQRSNVFENPGLGRDIAVTMRLAETDNYKQSEATAQINLKTYLNKITVIYADTDNAEPQILRSFFTNAESAEKEDEFKALIGDLGVIYYQCYYDKEKKNKVGFPLTYDGDMTFYAVFKKSATGSFVRVPTPTPTPTVTPSDTPIVPTPTPAVTPKPSNKPCINGYNGEIRPDGNLTRAEAAKIISIISGGYDEETVYANVYSDVPADKWYANYIGYASRQGWVKGYQGEFRPEDTITRAEFSAIVSRYSNIAPQPGTRFGDTYEDVWSTRMITALADCGLVKGYLDGNFYPENKITRAEGITIINRMIKRVPDKEKIDSIKCEFTDLPKTHWAYYDIMAAAYEY